MKKWVYLFTEGNANMRELLGGKGANLAEMTNIGLPVPQGFTITTEACTQYYEDGRERSRGRSTSTLLRWKRSPEKVRRPRESSVSIRSFRRESIHARYDGYHSEPWSE